MFWNRAWEQKDGGSYFEEKDLGWEWVVGDGSS